LVITVEKAAGIFSRSLTPNRPYHVQWMLTRKCNYRCRGCNVWQEQDTKELPTEKVKEGLDNLRKSGAIEVVLSGGNPLLRSDIGEIVDYASRYFVTTVYDNGSMAADRIDDLRNADFVAISIDSLDPEKNDYVKGVKDSLRKALTSVERLHEEGINVSVSPTISRMNLDEIVDLTSYFLSKDIPVWYCLYSFDLNAQDELFRIGKKNDEFTITDNKAIVNLFDAILRLKKGNKRILMTHKLLETVRDFYCTGKKNCTCRALQSFLVVDHIGRVSGCHLHEPVATVFDLPEVWNTPRLETLRDVYGRCTQCTYMCYIFYSLHGTVLGNVRIAMEHWRNAGLMLRKKPSRV